ncbi:MAG: hypothetical protein E6G77_21775 [Alphaproteobacteria bacterium]|nr:MAG: hypothetical protein E6G77_21775 [Alphaproteobacteria bacterium]
MAADTKQSTPNIGGNGFIWLLLAAAGTYFVAHQLPLEGSRPPTSEAIIAQRAGVQDVEARLWQDPFAAVAGVLARSPELKPENCQAAAINDGIKRHCQSPLNESALEGPLHERLLVMVAPVSGAPYSEQHESRRRTRYAILAGLNAEGFAPLDAEHVGFYWPGAATPAAAQQVQSPKVVPFEWFEPKSRRDSLPYKGVLLLWFDEDALLNAPLKQFEHFLCRSLVASRSPAPWAKATILGPSFSTTLQAMVDESSNKSRSSLCPDSARPEFYVNSATADDPTLISDYISRGPSCFRSDTCLQDFFAENGIKLYRMIATDQALAVAIRGELRLRGVDDKASHIALVSEWDTLYGRALPDSIARCFGEDERNGTSGAGCRQTDAAPFVDKPWLHRFKYLRGLDGQMPGSEAPAGGSKTSGNRQDKDAKDSTKASSDAKPQERAEGQGQFDYLRRLGDRIQQLDSDLRQKGSKGVEAVGILGSDLYDKLLVLQALRPLVPNALFFTTDLDALVLHPSALTYTRNLLVASSFGLQLRPAVQGETPPFRSSYQTAAFLATRTAIRGMAGAPAAWLKPRMFEVGSVRAVQFASPDSSHDAQFELDDTRTDNEQCQKGLECEEIHPLATAAFRNVSIPVAAAFSVLAVCAACYPLRRRVWSRFDSLMKGSNSYPELAARGLAVLIGVGVIIYAVATGIHQLWPLLARSLTQDGQPIILLNGLSLWPTTFLRALTLALCIGLIIRGYRLLNENIEKIFHDLDLMETRQRVEAEQKTLVGKIPPWIRFVSHFWYLLPSERVTTEGERVPDHMFRFWGMYIYQGYQRARFYRAAAGMVAIALLWPILTVAFGNPPVPARGSVSLVAYVIVTGALVLATWFLIFAVADTTLLTWRVIKGFRTEMGIWPQKTLQQFSDRFKLPSDVLDDWIDLVFVSKRTKCVTTFIYYPFLIIALLVVSRSRLFANYGPSVPDVITMGIALLIVSGCAVALRLSAEALRARALRRLNDRIMAARQSQDGERLAGQLELLVRRVEELRDGAFTPFSQQPLVRAMLLPLGSFGGTALLEYLLLPGLS